MCVKKVMACGNGIGLLLEITLPIGKAISPCVGLLLFVTTSVGLLSQW